MTAFYNKYQSYRQYFINPNYMPLQERAEAEDLLNPNTLVTSALLEQRNILRFQGVHPIPAKYYMHSKSATPISTLLTKLSENVDYQAYFVQGLDNIGVVTITDFDSSINLSDYQLLVFDRNNNDLIHSGFRINDFKSTFWYVINNTLYVILMNCTRYCNDENDLTSFADEVDVVLMRKVNCRDSVKIGLMEFTLPPNDPTTQVTENELPFTELQTLYLRFDEVGPKTTMFNRYNERFYGVALYLSEYEVEIGDVIYNEHDKEVTVTSNNITLINDAIRQTHIKNWLLIDPSKYQISIGDNCIIAEWNNIADVADLNLFIYASYSDTETGTSLPRMKIPVTRLYMNSKFYLYNKNTFIKTEYEYRYNPGEDHPIISVSRDNTTPLRAIEESFNVVRDDDDNIIGQYPNYIPMNWSLPNDLRLSDDPDSHIYGRWIDTEDVFVFVDGVKLTPYLDYEVSNNGFIGEDIPAGSIKFKNRNSSDTAETFPVFPICPVDESVSLHTILVFTIPSSVHRNVYYGPYTYGDHSEFVHDISEEVMSASDYKFKDSNGVYPILNIEAATTKATVSMLSPENYIVFAAGRYQRTEDNKAAIALDNALYMRELSTYTSIEYHSYFDDSKLSYIDNMWHNNSTYNPLAEKLIKYLTGADPEDPEYFDIEKTYMINFLADREDPEEPNRITEESSEAYGIPTDYIYYGGSTNIFELWLKHNTRLVFRNDIDAQDDTARRRVPDKQTYFSANDDLSERGYLNNIHVSGNDMPGMPEYTASNDINNEEETEDDNNG